MWLDETRILKKRPCLTETPLRKTITEVGTANTKGKARMMSGTKMKSMKATWLRAGSEYASRRKTGPMITMGIATATAISVRS